jgi:hypothetical protein
MNDTERQLARLLKAWAEEPPAHVTVQAVRRQRTRRQLTAATSTVAAIAVVASLGAGLSGRLGHQPPATPAPVTCRSGWIVARGAVPTRDGQDSLAAIAGSASDDLWAVGNQSPRHSRKVFPLLEHWDGRRWTYYPGASLGGRQGQLTSISASAANNVWAVGYLLPAGGPLIEHWNGYSWSLQDTNALDRRKALAGETFVSVVALAPRDVWVLGYPDTNSPDHDLHWNGRSWHLFPGPGLIRPNLGTGAMQIFASDHQGKLWAVGGTIVGQSEAGVPGRGVVERWDGRQMKVDRQYARKEPLTMVAPIAPGDVWAIAGGDFSTSGTYGVSPVKVLHWSAKGWRTALNLGGAASAEPTGIVALSGDDVYVMGQNLTSQRPFIDHWDGSRWSSVPLGPAGHLPKPGANEVPNHSLTVTTGGTIAALDDDGSANQANYLWLKC